ncbi:CLIP domain-containing serine protease HP8-like, partial [Maniola hyperantus]|uniref:CLIP domain-containing serine protease HP8-like n=1 Tax=Aphantopus hyperantus TaxID=2795564 RepID=UPI003749D4D5
SCGIYYGNSMFGTITEFEEHPWLTMIRHDKFRDSRIYCGGVLISSRYVLTAAHCVDVLNLPQNGKATHVRLGEWNTSSVIDCVWGDCNQPPLDVPVEEVVLHEDYAGHDGNQQNDIALLRLAYDVTFSDFVKPICLPIDTSLAQKTFEGYNLEVAGWGNTDTNQFLSAVKQKARLSVQNNSVCSQIYMMYDIDITEKHICAGKVFSEDPCTGDSGGPLMVKINGNWMVLGVESYSPSPCGTANRWPGVYTKVTAFVDWILSKLRP